MKSEDFRNNPMFLRNQFKGDGVFEIPKIEKEEIKLEKAELIGYDKLSESETDKIVHFFLDDYKFEVMWNDPEPRIERLKKYKAVLAPNYSIYTEMPLSLKVYNTFRSRWCGAYLQSKGIKVIPTVAWGEPNTFWFCFDGIEKGSIVAVSTLGVRKEKALFMQGYNELMRKIKPQAVICYGEPFEEMQGNVIKIDYTKTNHLTKEEARQKGYIKKITGYVIPHNEKGMGSAGGVDEIIWKPKKSDDKRFVGNPNTISEFTKENGEIVANKYGSNGKATKERHYSTHKREHTGHTNPHDHDIDWSNGVPRLGPPINYPDGNAPIFKKTERNEDMNNKPKYISEYSFDSIDDFKNSLIYGREIQFKWGSTEYGIFHDYDEGEKAFFICEANKDSEGTYFETVETLLEFAIQDKALKEIVTQVDVCWRNI